MISPGAAEDDVILLHSSSESVVVPLRPLSYCLSPAHATSFIAGSNRLIRYLGGAGCLGFPIR